jgi:hypothetical protein
MMLSWCAQLSSQQTPLRNVHQQPHSFGGHYNWSHRSDGTARCTTGHPADDLGMGIWSGAKEANGKDKKANGNSNGSTPTAENATQVLPGYQQTVYDRLVPEIFGMIMSPDFNSKDGQSQLVSWLGKEFKSKAHDICQVLHEVSSLLREIMIARGQEGIDFLLTFLTSKQCPLPAAQELVRRMRSEILRDFRRTFSDFIKDWKVALGLTQ